MKLAYILYRLRFRLREWIPFGRSPIHVDIELAGKCQLACRMCPYGDHEDGTGSFDASMQGMMPRQMAELALREARKNGALSAKLNFRGEPGLSPDLVDMVKLAKELGYVEIMLNTNLTAFSQRRLSDLCDAGLDLLIVSADGATKETYEDIRIKGDFERLIDNLEYIRGLHKRPKVRIQMTVQDRNRHEVDLMGSVFGLLCDEIKYSPVRSDNSGERKRCPQPWQRLVVAWNGQVFACCNSWKNEFPVGNIKQQSLEEIWNGERLKTLQKYAKHPEKGPPCDTCLVKCSYK